MFFFIVLAPGCNYAVNTLQWCNCKLLIQTIHEVGFTCADVFTLTVELSVTYGDNTPTME